MLKVLKKILMGFIYMFLIVWTILQIYPLIYMVLSSFKTNQEIISMSPWSLPKSLNFSNYIDIWKSKTMDVSFSNYIFNSAVVTIGTLTLLSVLALLCGYALARYKFLGNKSIYLLMVGLITIPVHSLLVPVYILLDRMKMTNNLFGIILVYTAFWLPFSVIIMRSYFETVPISIEEAARIDGCSEFEVFIKMAVPISRSGIVTVIIVNIVGIWSELMFASILLMEPKLRTLTLGVALFKTGIFNSTVAWLMASLCISSIPLIIVYLIFQKQIIKGMAVGAVK